MAGWNFAQLWETAAEALPDAPALVHGERRITWAEIDRRADGVAPGCSTSASTSRRRSRSTSTTRPSTWSRCSPRSRPAGAGQHELPLRRPGAAVPVGQRRRRRRRVPRRRSPSASIRLRQQLPKVRGWLWVDDGSGAVPRLGDAVRGAAAALIPVASAARGGSTATTSTCSTPGGTTGMPKGVMWRQDDLVDAPHRTLAGAPAGSADYDVARSAFAAPGPIAVPACPQMHGTGGITSIIALMQGGSS